MAKPTNYSLLLITNDVTL